MRQSEKIKVDETEIYRPTGVKYSEFLGSAINEYVNQHSLFTPEVRPYTKIIINFTRSINQIFRPYHIR